VQEGVLVFHGASRLFGAAALQPVEAVAAKTSVFQSLFGKTNRETTDNLKSDFLSPRVTATGGRLVTVVALGETVPQARETAYRNVERIQVAGAQFRRDIAEREE
jgi:hypothetical protein